MRAHSAGSMALSASAPTARRTPPGRDGESAETMPAEIFCRREDPPPAMLEHAVLRVRHLVGDRQRLRVLDPSVGDGAVIDVLARSGLDVTEFVGVDILGRRGARARLRSAGVPGQILTSSSLTWVENLRDASRVPSQPTAGERRRAHLGGFEPRACHRVSAGPAGPAGPALFDAAVGVLPSLPAQLAPDADQAAAQSVAARAGLPGRATANLWVPLLVAAITHVRRGGAFAFVLPSDALTSLSAGPARQWLLAHADDLRIDVFPAGAVSGCPDDRVVVSGRQSAPSSALSETVLTVARHDHVCPRTPLRDARADRPVVTRHPVRADASRGEPWTRYLLTGTHLAALEEFAAASVVTRLGEVATFEIAVVTGANRFFALTAADVADYHLGQWARPLLARVRHAPGLVYTELDRKRLVTSGGPAYLFDASLSDTPRSAHSGLDRYLAEGELHRLHTRPTFKTRSPWWAVPDIDHGGLFLHRRSAGYPRMVLNDTDAISTETLYRGRLLHQVSTSPSNEWGACGRRQGETLVAGFHNSGTLLAAELSGRVWGDGALELSPDDIGGLPVPMSDHLWRALPQLDSVCRSIARFEMPAEALREQTDELLARSGGGLSGDLLDTLAQAREVLVRGRAERGAEPGSATV